MQLELDQVCAGYPHAAGPALLGASLGIEKGEFVGIVGRTGSGKSTLAKVVDGLLTPTSGRMILDGKDINAAGYDRAELRRRVGFVFQYPERQLFESTVERDVCFGLRQLGMSTGEQRERARWALELMGFRFDAVAGVSPLGLSGGQRRRVAIAGVLAMRPEVIILDEPVAGLDPGARSDFMQVLARLNGEGATVLMISHNADALADFAQRIIALSGGRIVADGPTREVYADVERCLAEGIDLPQTRMFARALEERGQAIASDVISYDELLLALIERYGGGRA